MNITEYAIKCDKCKEVKVVSNNGKGMQGVIEKYGLQYTTRSSCPAGGRDYHYETVFLCEECKHEILQGILQFFSEKEGKLLHTYITQGLEACEVSNKLTLFKQLIK